MRSSILLCVIVLALCVFSAVASSIDPIVIVPGLSASALRNVEVDPLFARRWINLEQLLDPDTKHNYEHHLRTYWNATSGLLESAETILPYPGEEGVINLTGIPGIETEFYDLIKAIRTSSGGFRAVPYDWRLVPQRDVMNTFYTEMQTAIAELHYLYKKPVRIVAHSLGNLMTLSYLNWQEMTNATFITEKIAGYVGVSPPYAGAGLGIQAVTYGVEEVFERFDFFNHTVPFGKHIPQTLLGNFASFPWVFPQQRAFDFPVVVVGTSASYEPAEIPAFLATAYPFDNDVLDIYNNVIGKFDPAIFTNFPAGLTQSQVTLIVSTYAATCVGIQYTRQSNGQYQWSEITENVNDQSSWGDGTVPRASLHANDNLWQITPRIIEGVSHSGIIRDQEFISTIIELSGGFSTPGTA